MKLDPGAFAFGFIAEGIKRLRERRRRKRRWKELGLPEEGSMAIDFGTRTTTNMTISGVVVFGVMKLISTYFPGAPTEGLEELIGAVVAYVVGYFTKTPEQPKVL